MLEWQKTELETLKDKSQFQWFILDKVKKRITYMKTFLYMLECNKIFSLRDVKIIIGIYKAKYKDAIVEGLK